MLEIIKKVVNSGKTPNRTSTLSIIDKDKVVHRSNMNMNNEYGNALLDDIFVILENKIMNNMHNKLEWLDLKSSNIQYTLFEKEMKNYLDGDIEKQLQEVPYRNIPKNRGDKICISVTIENQYELDIFIENRGNELVTKKRILYVTDNPSILNRNNTLIINPSNLISVHIKTEGILLVKKVNEARKIHNLDKYFLQKARDVLGETVINANEIKINKNQVSNILKNHQKYSKDILIENTERYVELMRSEGIELFEDEPDNINFNEPSILLKKGDTDKFIQLLASFKKIDLISEEEEVIYDTVQ